MDSLSEERLPRWLKRNVPKGNANHFTARLVDDLQLATVCQHARCPNRMECYAARTATFLILGDVCTRGCGFCSVAKGRPRPVDADEPRRVAEAARRLGLRHIDLCHYGCFCNLMPVPGLRFAQVGRSTSDARGTLAAISIQIK